VTRILSRGVTRLNCDNWTVHGELAHMQLRRACEVAYVPLADAEGRPLPDDDVVEAVAAARCYRSLERAALVLLSESRRGVLPLVSRVFGGPIGMSEALVLASVLRSPVAEGIAP
jgi:hypothetical protein